MSRMCECGKPAKHAGLCYSCSTKKLMKEQPDKYEAYNKRSNKKKQLKGRFRSVSTMLCKHETDLHDDSERLSLEFLEEMFVQHKQNTIKRRTNK
jgi:hypothetical protein